MKITRISYGKTINIGNYQSIRVEYTADLDPTDEPNMVLHQLKVIVRDEEVRIKQENK